MADLDKLDLILDKLDDAASARRDQAVKLEALALSTTAHFVEDKAFMTATREEQARIAERVEALEARRDAETTQRLRALDEPKDTRLQLKRGVLALVLGAPVVILVGLVAAWAKHLFGW